MFINQRRPRDLDLLSLSVTLLFRVVTPVMTDVESSTYICKNDDHKIKMDTALLNISSVSFNITLDIQTSECWKCPLVPVMLIENNTVCLVEVDTRWPLLYRIRPSGSHDVNGTCGKKNFHFEEGGIYFILVSYNQQSSEMVCSSVSKQNNTNDSNIPIYVAIGMFVMITAFWITIKWSRRSMIFMKLASKLGHENLVDTSAYTTQDFGVPECINPADEPERPLVLVKERFRSLDAFRGVSIVVMIFVNYGGGCYWFFRHARWNGLTVADLVFPWFVFIMGTALEFSMQSLAKHGSSKKKVFAKIIKRTLLLFFLGIFINCIGVTSISLDEIRIPGVLQRLAVTYFVVATTHMFFVQRACIPQVVWWAPVRDIISYWVEWIIMLSLLVINLALTFGLPVSGCPRGYLGPGGLSDDGKYWNCTGGAAGYIDRIVFGPQHIYSHTTCKKIYHSTQNYDPEGLLGCLTSCFLCFIGLQAGKIFCMYQTFHQRVKRLLIWGFTFGVLAAVLCKCSQNGGWIPVNKNLWSLSFILLTSCFAFIFLTFCYLTIDVWKIWSGAPFYFAGMNAIALYIGHEVVGGQFPIYWKVSSDHASHLAINLWGTVFWAFVGWYMYHKKIFISL